jgi:PAS domain S-box-containing protein
VTLRSARRPAPTTGVAALAAVAVVHAWVQARRTLHRQRQAMAADASTSADWLWETDAHGRLTYSSDGVTTLLGHSPADLIGRDITSLLQADDAAAARDLLRRARIEATGWRGIEFTWRHKDGSPVRLQGFAEPIRDRRARVVGFRGSRRRATEAITADRGGSLVRDRVLDLVERRDLTIALQPMVDLATGRMSGAEALARFPDGRGPEEWFRDARDAGHVSDLDRATFTAALSVLEVVPPQCYLSVNATPELLADASLVRELVHGDLPHDRLVIEVTEHVKIACYEDLHAALAPLRERGVRIAVDDTGAGYASMQHVLQLRPDVIKIDRSLVADVSRDPARRALITAFVLLALELEATVAAETPAELETLASLGVDCAQGYLLARPATDRDTWQAWFARNWLQSSRPGDPQPARAAGPRSPSV